jgi:hypothetical protein
LHYESIDDIPKEFFQDQIDQLLVILEQENYFHHPLEFDKVFQAMNRLLEQNLPLYRHIVKKGIFRDFWDPLQNILEETIVAVYKDISILSLEELEIYAKFYSAGITAIYIDWLNDAKDMPIEQLGEIAGKLLAENIRFSVDGRVESL